jgi:hypothetical protein
MDKFKVQDSTYTASFGNFSLPQFQMFGVVLAVFGLYMLYILNFFFLLILPLGVALSTARVGVQINFETRQHREYVNIFGFLFGKWKPIPKLEYVTVFVEHYAQRGSVASIDNEFDFEKVKVSLIISEPERLEAGLFDTKETGIEAGKLLAKKLKTKLLDFTSHEPGWVEL